MYRLQESIRLRNPYVDPIKLHAGFLANRAACIAEKTRR